MGQVGPTAGCGSASEQTTQLVAVDTGISQNSGHCAALELAMKRHDQRDGAIRVLEADVAATLTHRHPSELAER